MRKLSIQHILPAGRIFVAAAVLLTPAAAQDRRIAIYDFESRAADASLRGRVPQAINLGHQAAGQVMTRLVNSNTRFEVIERADIERILKEQGRKYDERFDPASAPELGRLLNVDGIVLGEVVSASAAVQGSSMRIPGTKTSFGGRQAKAKIHIAARLISTQTGSIQVAQEADGEGTESVSSSVTGVTSGTGGDEHTALSSALAKAIAKAVTQISSAIIDKASTLPKIQHPGAPLNTPTSGGAIAPAGARVPIVNSVDGTRVYIEGGQEFKLAAGDRYDIRQVTKVLKLSNGQTSEVRETVETVVIDDVQGALSIAHVEGASPSRAKPGDTLQKSTSLPAILQSPQNPAAGPRSGIPVKKFLPGNGIPREPR